MNFVCCSLSTSIITNSYWPPAMADATFKHNKMVHSATVMIPYISWTGTLIPSHACSRSVKWDGSRNFRTRLLCIFFLGNRCSIWGSTAKIAMLCKLQPGKLPKSGIRTYALYTNLWAPHQPMQTFISYTNKY